MSGAGVSQLQVERLGHVNVYTRSLEPALELQRCILGATVFREWDMPGSGSRNALSLVGRTCIETFAPTTNDLEVGAWLARHGPGWHSLEWTVPSMAEALEAVQQRGLRITEQTEGFLFTHPKDLHGVALELTDAHFEGDDRDASGYDPDCVTGAHPMGIEGIAVIKVSAASPDAARAAAEDVGALVGRAVDASEYDHLDAVGYAVRFDDHALEFVASAGGVSTDLVGSFAAARGARIFAVTFMVRDLPQARAHLVRAGVEYDEFGGHSLWLGPEAAYGARIEFTDGG